jgi:hypothetical protein
VVEVVVADEVVVFALLLCVDVSEEGAKVIDAAEVFEVEDLFHGGGVAV